MLSRAFRQGRMPRMGAQRPDLPTPPDSRWSVLINLNFRQARVLSSSVSKRGYDPRGDGTLHSAAGPWELKGWPAPRSPT